MCEKIVFNRTEKIRNSLIVLFTFLKLLESYISSPHYHHSTCDFTSCTTTIGDFRITLPAPNNVGTGHSKISPHPSVE
ncbi:hypothetical protein LSTR_LSTR012131 [Laodelphax striatellus]|uniref:Uncharacterized protein n=1 Tax=Laodelphax striatellus TaxID=195883 RepID=A0A482XPI6_LAOST|nr:hypothetical protein LSTR_LSTR012131 [Laodelphax striatellus]